MMRKNCMKLIPALMLLGFAGAASAAGFAIQNQAGSGNGNAFAGAAAAAEDAGTIYFNPAGMTYLPQGHNITAVGTLLERSIKYDDTGTFTRAGVIAAPNITVYAPTGDGGDAGGLGLIPAGYWSYAYSQALRVGVGVSPTFGNETEYSKNFRGFNSGFFGSMRQININPSVAYKLNDMVSLGAGLNFAHNEIEFKFGVPVQSPTPAVGAPAGTFVKVEGDDWATGYNLGAMFQLSPNTRLGLTYRSKTKFDLEGEQKVSATGATLTALGVVNQDVKASIDMPDSASLAISHQYNRWQFLADYTWTGWSSIDNVALKNKDTGRLIKTLSYNFQDTYRVGLGVSYQYNEQVKTRFGTAYDKSPVKSAAYRTMTLPDSDRTWLSFGINYALSKASSLDFGYSHIFFKTARASANVTSATGVILQTINGKWDDNSADLLSAAYNHNF
ncbi:MAG: aromatic hydrocarbon degradation protein [Betaproteobacteria bacterium]|nr:aromatic hydrocarbon degradation protein [Betaproteobacteria bacterium]